jgi:hypothetical protein
VEANLGEIDWRINDDGHLPKEGIVQVDLDEMLRFIEVLRQQANKSLRVVVSLNRFLALVRVARLPQLFLLDEFQLEGNRDW